MPNVFFDNLNLECSIRLVFAGICGALIGIERMRRNKGAGLRTHVIVAIGAALFVIVSKYGFSDVLIYEGTQVDVSRVASNIVTGISFLGAGIISMREDSIQGLTTAAGVWVTAAVGLAIGSGMYLLGGMGAVFVLILQILLHCGVMRSMESTVASRIVVCMDDDDTAFEEFRQKLQANGIQIGSSHIKRHKDNTLTYTLNAQIPKSLQAQDILLLVKECRNVKSIGM